VPEKMIGTLTSSLLKSVHTSISPIFSYKLCSVATPGHPKPLSLQNHVRIVTLTPDLQRMSFCSVIDFLYHSSTTELLLSLILIKGSYSWIRAPSLRAAGTAYEPINQSIVFQLWLSRELDYSRNLFSWES